MNAQDWLAFCGHFALLSLLSVGGAITAVPDMHRYLVDERQWLSDPQFAASIAIAQAAPGPNVLFVGLLGWHVGLNAAGWVGAIGGLLGALLSILIPSSLLSYWLAQWGHRNRELREVRAFKQGMAPLVIGLLVSTGWILATSTGYALANWPLWLLAVASAVLVWRTKLHVLWLLAVGALLGALGGA